MDILYIDCHKIEKLTCINDKKDDNQLLHSFKDLPFRVQKITLQKDKPYSLGIIEKVKNRIKDMKFNSADSAGNKRDTFHVSLKSFCGMLVEQLCYDILSHYNKKDNIVIALDSSNSSKEQVDIKINKIWKEKRLDKNNKEIYVEKSIAKTIEVRSSFPFCSIEESVSKNFDILGYYVNDIKTIDFEKDFYLRFLYEIDYKNNKDCFHYKKDKNNKKYLDYSESTINFIKKEYFDSNFNLMKDIVIYFIGGATNDMMKDDSIAYNGTMSSRNFNTNRKGIYHKIKARNALDCISIMQLILNVITNENIEKK